jgi:hypothetical protein
MPVKILIAARKELAIIPISVVFSPRLTEFLLLCGSVFKPGLKINNTASKLSKLNLHC